MDRSIDAAVLASIAAELQDQPDEARTVSVVLEHALEVVPDAQHGSLTVRRRGTFVTLASTSELAQRADELQYEHKEGPCLDAAVETDWNRSGDVRADPRWPAWAAAAADIGIRSLLSVKLEAKERRIGALNLYSTELDRFADRDDIDLAQVYSIHVAYALSSTRTVSSLQAAMESRHAIGVAQGILMERYDLDAERAFAFLRRVSSVQNRPVRQVAAEIVELRRLHGLDIARVHG